MKIVGFLQHPREKIRDRKKEQLLRDFSVNQFGQLLFIHEATNFSNGWDYNDRPWQRLISHSYNGKIKLNCNERVFLSQILETILSLFIATNIFDLKVH